MEKGKRRDFMSGLRVDGDRNMSIGWRRGRRTAGVAFLGKVKKTEDKTILQQIMNPNLDS